MIVGAGTFRCKYNPKAEDTVDDSSDRSDVESRI
jgi:hypothetical protein